ncbi:IS4 family transposase, partial [Streptomyces sp. NPDC055036]
MVGLVECGTHAVFDAAIGALRTGERALARAVLVSLRPGMLLLADRGFYCVDLWREAAATGADLLWRVRKDLVLPVVEQLPDGFYLTEIFDRSDIHHTRRGVPVRAVEYTITGHESAYRLLTTILNPDTAPATELATLYAQRWEFESTLDEIKTHLGGPHLVLRSQHPDGAEQELYGFLLVHHPIRHLTHQVARQGDHDPDRISFTRSLRVVRRKVTSQAAFPPGRLTRAVKATHTELLERLLPPRRHRANPRIIKRKVANRPLKR